MTAIDPTMTLAELINQRPDLARELEVRALDYCCGGGQSLADACTQQGLDVAEVAAALGSVAARATPPTWTTLGPAEMVDHLEATHHAYLHDELPRLAALVEKVAGVHGERHPELTSVHQLYGELRDDLVPHLAKEEQVLFPLIRELVAPTEAPAFHCGTLRNPILVMLREHDQVGDLLARLRAATDGYAVPDDGCESYKALYRGLEALEADTHLHVHKENNILFPAVLALEAETTR